MIEKPSCFGLLLNTRSSSQRVSFFILLSEMGGWGDTPSIDGYESVKNNLMVLKGCIFFKKLYLF